MLRAIQYADLIVARLSRIVELLEELVRERQER
jgi:hypothetical protein